MNSDWYNKRNKRTDSFTEVNESCHSIKVGLTVTADINLYDTQVMFIVLSNILSRWCNNIDIVCNNSVNLTDRQSSDEGILSSVKRLLKEIDPYGTFVFNERSDNDKDIMVFVGPPQQGVLCPFIAIDGHGWVSSCSFGAFGACERSTTSKNPIGPAFAACLANAELFRWANQIIPNSYTKWHSLYDLSVEENVIQDKVELELIDLGRIHIVGCGAIGSSFAYLLKLINLKGNLTFIDADKGVELHNTSSSLLFTSENLSPDKTKAEICSEYIGGELYEVNQPFNGDYNHYGYEHKQISKSADVILCFANDHNIWSTIQHLYPPIVFHATTSRSWGINVGRHIPLKDNCLMCTFKELAEMKYVPTCAKGEIPKDRKIEGSDAGEKTDEPHASILPFLSPAAAIIAMAELIKLLTGKVPNENTTQFNMSTKDGIFIEDQHRAGDCYICKDQSLMIYKRLNVKMEF